MPARACGPSGTAAAPRSAGRAECARAAARAPGPAGSSGRRDRRSCRRAPISLTWNSSCQTSATVRSISLAGATYAAAGAGGGVAAAAAASALRRRGQARSERARLGARFGRRPRPAGAARSVEHRSRGRGAERPAWPVELQLQRACERCRGQGHRVVGRRRAPPAARPSRRRAQRRRRRRCSSGRPPGSRTGAAARDAGPVLDVGERRVLVLGDVEVAARAAAASQAGDGAFRRRAARAPAGCSRTGRPASRRREARPAGRRRRRRTRRRRGRSSGRGAAPRHACTTLLSVTCSARAADCSSPAWSASSRSEALLVLAPAAAAAAPLAAWSRGSGVGSVKPCERRLPEARRSGAVAARARRCSRRTGTAPRARGAPPAPSAPHRSRPTSRKMSGHDQPST